MITFDIETTGLDPWRDTILGIAFCTELGEASYWSYEVIKAGACPYLPFLADPGTYKLGHNARFDIKFLLVHGIEFNGPWDDTMLLSQLLDENCEHGLKPLSRKHRLPTPAFKELSAYLKQHNLPWLSGKSDYEQDLLRRYACEDVTNTHALWRILLNTASNDIMMYYHDETMPLECVLLEMELRGIRINEELLGRARATLCGLVSEMTGKLEELLHDDISAVTLEMWAAERAKYKTTSNQLSVKRPEFNWNSGDQLVKLFYGRLGLGQYSNAVTDAGKPSMNSKDLARAQVPDGVLRDTLRLYDQRNRYSKMRSTYADGIHDRLREGRVHGEYMQCGDGGSGGTVTGRLSHRNPNLGNLPRGGKDYWSGAFVKDMMIPDYGMVFVHADYSQIELRIGASLANDTPFIQAFNNNEDPHQQTADKLCSMGIPITRQQAKTVNFLLLYGGSAWRLCFELGFDPVKQPDKARLCDDMRSGFFRAHPDIDRWIQTTRRSLQQHGELRTVFGRVRRIPEVWSSESTQREHALKQGVNFVVQSTAASVCKRAMIALYKQGLTLVNQVHDSIDVTCRDIDAPSTMALILDTMSRECRGTFHVPLLAEAKILKTLNERGS